LQTRGAQLAAGLEATNLDLLTYISGLSEAQWAKTCPDEGWTVGVTAHHVAEGLGLLAGFVQAMAAGAPVPPISQDALDGANAEHAARAAGATRDETAALLGANIQAAVAAVRTLTDDQLRNRAVLAGAELSLDQLVELILTGHAAGHLAGIRAATA
jgi:hypothetical protein